MYSKLTLKAQIAQLRDLANSVNSGVSQANASLSMIPRVTASTKNASNTVESFGSTLSQVTESVRAAILSLSTYSSVLQNESALVDARARGQVL